MRLSYLKYLELIVLSWVLTECREPAEKVVVLSTETSKEKDTLIPFTIELVKKLDNKIQWTRIELDSITANTLVIHRPIYSLIDRRTETKSLKDIDLSRYFTKEELNHFEPDTLDFEIIKRYNTVRGIVDEITFSKMKYWYEESNRLTRANPNAVIPPSFLWYFGITQPLLSKDKQYIYLELMESGYQKSVFWVYLFKKENGTWKLFHVNKSVAIQA